MVRRSRIGVCMGGRKGHQCGSAGQGGAACRAGGRTLVVRGDAEVGLQREGRPLPQSSKPELLLWLPETLHRDLEAVGSRDGSCSGCQQMAGRTSGDVCTKGRRGCAPIVKPGQPDKTPQWEGMRSAGSGATAGINLGSRSP